MAGSAADFAGSETCGANAPCLRGKQLRCLPRLIEGVGIVDSDVNLDLLALVDHLSTLDHMKVLAMRRAEIVDEGLGRPTNLAGDTVQGGTPLYWTKARTQRVRQPVNKAVTSPMGRARCEKIMRAVALSVAAMLAGSAADTVAAPPPKPAAHCFSTTQFDGWRAADATTLFIRADVDRYYRIDLAQECTALTAPDAQLILECPRQQHDLPRPPALVSK